MKDMAQDLAGAVYVGNLKSRDISGREIIEDDSESESESGSESEKGGESESEKGCSSEEEEEEEEEEGDEEGDEEEGEESRGKRLTLYSYNVHIYCVDCT
jgi:hypothetical protein